MICFEFKGGTGTASRTLKALDEEWVVGTLVQANFGRRDLLRVDGRPVGRELGIDVIPSAHPLPEGAASGSLIVVLASNAPLLPIQCQRLARRATLGMARVGGAGADGSGDLFLAFSTANHVQPGAISTVRMADSTLLSGLFEAAAESVEEAILNAMTAAETMTGQSCRVATAVPLERLQAICQRKP
jgi:D-aminopeptidase